MKELKELVEEKMIELESIKENNPERISELLEEMSVLIKNDLIRAWFEYIHQVEETLDCYVKMDEDNLTLQLALPESFGDWLASDRSEEGKTHA